VYAAGAAAIFVSPKAVRISVATKEELLCSAVEVLADAAVGLFYMNEGQPAL
jgi:hypothetical protein